MITKLPEKPLDGQKMGNSIERKTGLSIPPPSDACALKRVTFQTSTPQGALVLCTFGEPKRHVAWVEEKGTSEWPSALAYKDSAAMAEADFDCVCLDSKSIDAEAIARAEAWIDPKSDTVLAESVRIALSDGWLLAKNGRAVICLPKSAWNAALSALADFFFHDCELRKLEREIAADWPRAEQDLSLANDVTPKDLKRLDDIGATTRSVWLRRIRLAKLERPLAKCQLALPAIGQKLAARLRAKFDVADRAETLGGQIEVYEYIYEMANQRMGEYGNFRKEYLLEIVIVVLLAAELCVMVLDFIRNSHSY